MTDAEIFWSHILWCSLKAHLREQVKNGSAWAKWK